MYYHLGEVPVLTQGAGGTDCGEPISSAHYRTARLQEESAFPMPALLIPKDII